jgi:hypothetical protein
MQKFRFTIDLEYKIQIFGILQSIGLYTAKIAHKVFASTKEFEVKIMQLHLP